MHESTPKSRQSVRRRSAASPLGGPLRIGLAAAAVGAIAGCHDGPMYGLKAINPYYSMKQWKADEALGTTDHVRRGELTKLVGIVGALPENRQRYWLDHVQRIMEHDESAEMRRLAVLAAGNMSIPEADAIFAEAIRDESLKVRLATCTVLGTSRSSEAVRLLAETAGRTTDTDVRNAAFEALANHRHPMAVEALRPALEDRDPATRSLAIECLKRCTGKNYGDDPQAWIAALDGQDVPEEPVQLAERLKNLF